MEGDGILSYLEQHDVRRVKLAGTDLDGIVRGK